MGRREASYFIVKMFNQLIGNCSLSANCQFISESISVSLFSLDFEAVLKSTSEQVVYWKIHISFQVICRILTLECYHIMYYFNFDTVFP